MLPEDARLAHDLSDLRKRAAALEAVGNTQQANDLADVVLLVDGHRFRLVGLSHMKALAYTVRFCLTCTSSWITSLVHACMSSHISGVVIASISCICPVCLLC